VKLSKGFHQLSWLLSKNTF